MRNRCTDMKRIALFTCLVILSASCARKDTAVVSGVFSGLSERTVILDRITVSNITAVDTVVTDEKGRFRFKIALEDRQPAFYNLRQNGYVIPLLISPGEKVTVRSLSNIEKNYTVEGSPGSEQLRELTSIMQTNQPYFDSLIDRIVNPTITLEEKTRIFNEYYDGYIQQKRKIVRFIVENVGSLSSVYALYLQVPTGERIFGEASDAVYYRLVADTLEKHYPESPHVKSLRKDVQSLENQIEINRMIIEAQTAASGFPELEMPDMFGNKVKLSSLKGDVILLDFWSAANPGSYLLNAELTDLYNQYAEKGFSIYQVALDESKSLWVNAVQEQKIPWISVCDFQGLNSPAVRRYNVNSLPHNFLIDREGQIVARNVPVEELKSRIEKLL